MKRSNSDTTSITKQSTLVQVARMYFEENLSQQEIATRLSVSRSLIAQYLQHARELNIVRIQVIDPTNSCTELEAALKKATGVRHITIIPNPRGSELLAVRAVSGAAAEFISDALKDGYSLGLAWGRTTTEVVDQLVLPPGRQVNVVPLMGETSHSGLHSQMSQMVMRAAQRMQAKAHFLSLPMVLSTSRLRDALLKEDGCRDVIQYWDKINVACFGIGVVPPVPGMVAYIGERHLPRLLKAGAVGDICGVYFDREGSIIRTGLESRTVAVELSQLRSIGCMVAVACGEKKTIAIVGALRTGLITALFIDQALAEGILAEISAEKHRS